MTEQVELQIIEGVAFVILSHPPRNALDAPMRTALAQVLGQAIQDDTVQELVLMGEGDGFAIGADIAGDAGAPSLREICLQVETCPKPVIAALHGVVLGAGFELALACHYRLALEGARAGLPEVLIGLPPSGGATQRLTRLIGARLALDILLSGAVFTLTRPPGEALLDARTGDDLRGSALRFAHDLRARGAGPRPSAQRRDGLVDIAAYQEAIASYDGKVHGLRAEILRLVDSALLLPFDLGNIAEQEAYETALKSAETAGLRHAQRIEMSAFALPNAPGTLPALERIAILGPGPLAMQITASALNAGLGVNWGALDEANLTEDAARLREVFSRTKATHARLSGLSTGLSKDMVIGVDLIIHAARGQATVHAAEGVPRYSTIGGMTEPMGLYFGQPVFTNRLLEIAQGAQDAPRHLAYALSLARQLRKSPVLLPAGAGSAMARLDRALAQAADALVDLGADPYEVDNAIQAFGWTQLPFQSRDQAGLAAFARHPRAAGAHNWSAKLIDAGRKGRAFGAGFYDWENNTPRPSLALTGIMGQQRAPRLRPEREITALLLGAMANEGLRMMACGQIDRIDDLDLVSLNGLEFPRSSGGIMKAVSLMGPARIVKMMNELDHPDKLFWTPEPGLSELAAS